MDRKRRYLDVAILGESVRAAELPDGRYEIISESDSKSATISGDVATVMIQDGLPESVVEASLVGIAPYHVHNPVMAAESRDWIARFRGQLPDGAAVLFDSTTVGNALDAVTERIEVTPLRLLDLSLLTYAALTADKIVLQPSSVASHLAAQHPDLFYVLSSPGPRFEESLLRSTNHSVDYVISRPGMMASLEAAWRSFLSAGQGGADWVRLDPTAFDRNWKSPQCWDAVLSVDYQQGLLSRCFTGTMPSSEGLRSHANLFITVQTYRAFRNFGVAGLLGLPYFGSVLRLPAYEQGLRTGRSRARAIELILSRATRPSMPESALGVMRLKAPVPLQMVLKRMHRPGDYFAVLAHLREEFGELRRDVHQRLVAGENPESIASDYRQMLNKLTSRATSIGPVVTFVSAAAAIPFVLLTPSHIVLSADQIAVALGALSSIPCYQGALARWAARASHSYVAPLLALSEQAGTISSLADDVQRIWHTVWSDDEDAVLDGISRRANQFAFLGAA